MTPNKNASRSQDGASRARVDEPRFLTLDDVAVLLNVSTTQVYALVRSGELPAIKIGGRGVWRVDREQIDTYIERKHEETRQWAQDNPLNPREKS